MGGVHERVWRPRATTSGGGRKANAVNASPVGQGDFARDRADD